MNKLPSLRSHILALPTELKIEPDDLTVFADDGQIESARDGTNQHFEFKYRANVIITNYSGQFDQLTYWVLQWLATNQPNHQETPMDFEADILNDDSVDLSLTINLTETIKVESTEDGIKLNHVDDPSHLPVLLNAVNWTLLANDDPVADWVNNG